jgi:hypothetical protein
LRAIAGMRTNNCVFIDGWASRPCVRFHGVFMTASRAVWIMANGDPGELYVLHTCSGGSGETGCVNPAHLRLGTQRQNVGDMDEAGRRVKAAPRGEACSHAKLNRRQVREIRRRWVAGSVNQKVLAAEYGVSPAAISLIVRGKNWAWLPDEPHAAVT